MAESLEAKLEEEWRTIELYEKVRVVERRKKIIFSTLALLTFLTLCAVPVVEERMPKWKTLKAAQQLSFEIDKLKLISIKNKKPARLTFLENGDFKVELIDQCKTTGPESAPAKLVEQKHWEQDSDELKVLNPAETLKFDVKLAIDEICFDPVYGAEDIKSKKVVVIAPVKDLSENRLDRASYIIIESDSAKISIN